MRKQYYIPSIHSACPRYHAFTEEIYPVDDKNEKFMVSDGSCGNEFKGYYSMDGAKIEVSRRIRTKLEIAIEFYREHLKEFEKDLEQLNNNGISSFEK